MLSFFLNPWTMVAGAALVSAPIIIHLINRMRFRRVRWAAMEFLLKAQKRMRRKMIIEQLILLFLRCLLVFLVGLLFARFLGFNPLEGKETRPTLHVVILDDTPSMADTGGEQAGNKDAFSEARRQITEKILPAAAEATTAQRIRILKLSTLTDIVNPDPSKDPEQINSVSIERIKGLLGAEQVATVRTSLLAGVNKAKELLDSVSASDTARVLHIVSDLRAVDWSQEGEGLSQAIQELNNAGVRIHLLDVASPYRKPDKKIPAFSDNVGIVELKPRNRVAARDQPIDLEVRVKNYGTADLAEVGVQFYLNGQGNIITTLVFPNIPAGQERSQLFQVTFNQTATADDPLARFNLVTAVLTNTGVDALAADNIRHTIVEVRDKLSVLVLEGRPELRDDKKGDSFYLRRLFQDAFGGINWVAGTPDMLEKQDLRQYSSIYLLNVPQLTTAQVKNLERYVKEGGGVGIFLGPDVRSQNYNTEMYRDGEGFFPVPLPPNPSEPLKQADKDRRARAFSKRILLREAAAKTHPALAGIYTNERGAAVKDSDVERFFYFPNFDQHWEISRLGKWREDRSVQELYCLPNERPMADFEEPVVKMIDAVKAKYGEPKFEKYRELVNKQLDAIRATAGGNEVLAVLARQLDSLLCDQVSEGDPEAARDEALLREFWGHPELAEAKVLAQALRDACKFGDPLYLAKRFGNGRVTVMTTSVADPMTDWPAFSGAAGWVAVCTEMQKYLSGGGAEENWTVGQPLNLTLESGRYDPTVQWVYLSVDATKPDKVTQVAPILRDPPKGKEPFPLPLESTAGDRLNFTQTNRPGAYLFTLTWKKREGEPGPDTKPEYLAAVFNIDTAMEGDLRRSNGDDLKTIAKGAEVHSPDDSTWLDTLKQKQTDLSSGRWIYLVILLVLIAEQAMAVRLSHHGRPEDLEAFAPSAAAAFARGSKLTGSVGGPVASEEPATTSA
jgi:hypothetical protein